MIKHTYLLSKKSHYSLVLVALLLGSCASSQQRLTEAALKGDEITLDKYLRPGAADINGAALIEDPQALCPEQNTLTPLQAASCTGQSATVMKLIDNKADPNLATSSGQTPLFLALNNGNEDVVRLLVKGGAKSDTADAGGNTVLMFAAKTGNKSLADFMLKNGASAQMKNLAGETALMLSSSVELAKMFKALGCDPLLKNNSGDSALHIAARNGNVEVTKFFIERGVQVDLRNNSGATALSLARAASQGGVSSVLEEKLSQMLSKELNDGDQAAKRKKTDEALSLYTAALSRARDLGGLYEQNVLVKIIAYVKTLPNPPSLSEEAREHLVRSDYMLKRGQDINEVEKEMTEVLRIAPWWIEGYYNLGILQAGQNKFEKATENLTLFIKASPGGPKTQAAQDKIYEIKIAKEEADKISAMQGQWSGSNGQGYNVGVTGNKLQISGSGMSFTLTIKNNVIEGSVEGRAQPGPHGCTLPGQIHPVTGKIDSDAKGISLDFLWSSYDTRFHCVDMMGNASNCCLLCDEVCDAVSIVGTSNVSIRLTR